MSIILALKCRGAIVMAADSQTTQLQVAKRYGTQKISRIKFKNGWALVGEAGGADYSRYAVQSLARKARSIEIKDETTISTTAAQAVNETRNHIIGLRKAARMRPLFDDFDPTINFELTVGYFHNGRPFVFKSRSSQGTAIEDAAPFSTSGVGDYLAFYLMKDFAIHDLSSHQATLFAAYVVHEVKWYVDGCGGDTSLFVIGASGKPEQISKEETENISQKIAKFSESDRLSRLSNVSDLVRETAMDYNPGNIETPGGWSFPYNEE